MYYLPSILSNATAFISSNEDLSCARLEFLDKLAAEWRLAHLSLARDMCSMASQYTALVSPEVEVTFSILRNVMEHEETKEAIFIYDQGIQGNNIHSIKC